MNRARQHGACYYINTTVIPTTWPSLCLCSVLLSVVGDLSPVSAPALLSAHVPSGGGRRVLLSLPRHSSTSIRPTTTIPSWPAEILVNRPLCTFCLWDIFYGQTRHDSWTFVLGHLLIGLVGRCDLDGGRRDDVIPFLLLFSCCFTLPCTISTLPPIALRVYCSFCACTAVYITCSETFMLPSF